MTIPEPAQREVGMRLTDLLSLSHVPRWSIVDTIKEQSVADHTFRTMVIARELATQMGIKVPVWFWETVMYHDAEESRTGDIPASASVVVAQGACPWLSNQAMLGPLDEHSSRLLKLADKIEAYTFLLKYGVGPHAHRVQETIWKELVAACPNDDWKRATLGIVGDIAEEAGR